MLLCPHLPSHLPRDGNTVPILCNRPGPGPRLLAAVVDAPEPARVSSTSSGLQRAVRCKVAVSLTSPSHPPGGWRSRGPAATGARFHQLKQLDRFCFDLWTSWAERLTDELSKTAVARWLLQSFASPADTTVVTGWSTVLYSYSIIPIFPLHGDASAQSQASLPAVHSSPVYQFTSLLSTVHCPLATLAPLAASSLLLIIVGSCSRGFVAARKHHDDAHWPASY